MILDEIKNIGHYKGISKNLDTAIMFLQTTDITTLPIGKTEIDNDNVFLTVMEVNPKDEQELQFEYHKQYMDIQMDIEGIEAFYVGSGEMEIEESFHEDTDFGICTVKESTRCILGSGKFILCMPEEAHMPSVYFEEDYVKKAVIKVKKDMF